MPGDDDEVIRDPEKREMDLVKAELERKLPAGMAELYIYSKERTADGKERFGIRTTCCCLRAQDLEVGYGKPRLDFNTQLRRDGRLPASFLRAMRAWSSTKPELHGWLYGQYHRHETELELVIWDSTKLRIPWELFWLSGDPLSDERSGYLGALLTVTRWLTMPALWPKLLRPFLNEEPYRGTGSILAFIDPEMDDDKSVLDGLKVDFSATMRALFSKLRTAAGPLAMVYIAGHGKFSDQPEDCELAGYPLEDAYQFDDRLARLREHLALVFINACNSGSLGIDEGTYNDDVQRGFAEVFLRAGAAGVLATMGEVDTTVARTVAQDLLEYLRVSPEVPVARALRVLRARAWHAIEDAQDAIDDALLNADVPADQRAAAEESLLRLIDHFMYVYYGSPRLSLTFVSGGGPTATGGTR